MTQPKPVVDEIEDLQAVSQHVLVSAEEIQSLEEQKRSVDPASERFRELSDEIEVVAEEIKQISHAETGLARELDGVPGLPTIAEADASSGPSRNDPN